MFEGYGGHGSIQYKWSRRRGGSKQVNEGVYFTALITYKTPSVVNGKLVTVSLALGEGVACKSIFSWPFLQTIKASIVTNNNALVRGIIGGQFRLEMLVTQGAKEAPKTSEGLPVLLPVSIQGKQENMKNISIMNRRVELKNTVIHQHQIPVQH